MIKSIDPSEKNIGFLQEESQTTLQQFKALEYIIASEEIKVDGASQLRELYKIKLKCDSWMLETNVNNFLE